MNEPATSGRFGPCQSQRFWATLGDHQPDLVRTMPISVSTDPIRPTERQAFWTEAICRSFANIETKPLGSTVVSGHFEFVEIGDAKLVRFDSSPQCYTRDARLVSRAGSDEFMFDFQRRGHSAMVQAGNEGTINPGYGVLYDARRPFEDRLFGPEHRAEVLIATVPAATLLRAVPDAERLCAKPVPLSGTVARSIAALVREAISLPDARAQQGEPDIVAYLSALLRLAAGASHQLARARPVRPDRYLSEGQHRHDQVSAGARDRIRHFRANLSPHLRRPRDHVRAAFTSSACRVVPKSAAAGFAGRHSDRETRASVRVCRCRACHAHIQEQIWRHAAGFSRRRTGRALVHGPHPHSSPRSPFSFPPCAGAALVALVGCSRRRLSLAVLCLSVAGGAAVSCSAVCPCGAGRSLPLRGFLLCLLPLCLFAARSRSARCRRPPLFFGAASSVVVPSRCLVLLRSPWSCRCLLFSPCPRPSSGRLLARWLPFFFGCVGVWRPCPSRPPVSPFASPLPSVLPSSPPLLLRRPSVCLCDAFCPVSSYCSPCVRLCVRLPSAPAPRACRLRARRLFARSLLPLR